MRAKLGFSPRVAVIVLVLALLSLSATAAQDAGTRRTPAPGWSMDFHIHGFKGESYSFKVEGSTVRYRAGQYHSELDMPWRQADVKKERLDWFKKYVGEMGVVDWKSEYVCLLFDGVGWQFEFRSEGRTVAARGSNAFPPRFNELQLLIAWLVQARFGIAVEEKDCGTP